MAGLVVVDDELAFGNFVGRVATDVGYDVRIASCAHEFRQSIRELSPAVLVIDLQMPDVDGIELLHELGEQQCKAKIVMVSGMDSRLIESSSRMGAEMGLSMAGSFSKPIRATELKQLLSKLLPVSVKITPETLKSAIADDSLFLAYQPKIGIKTGQMEAVEALVRWKDKDGQVIYPDSFIPMAEKQGCIPELTNWVVEHAIMQASTWRNQGAELKVAINLSALCIRDRQLPDKLLSICNRHNLPPDSVILELTETASQQDSIMLLEVLGRFRLKGFHLSIDDFGTGYSSISQLLKLPFTELKIDKSFILNMESERDSAIVSKTIVDLARNLGLSSVAEGVETPAALSLLREWGCDVAQGYYFSKPTTAEEIKNLLAGGIFKG